MMNRLILIPLLSSLSIALPSGSPFCEINSGNYGVFQAEHGKQSKALYFRASFKEENGAYKISLQGNQPIHGVLLYVTGADKKTHLGKFSPKDGFKFVDECSGPYGSTLTHSSSDIKKDTEFTWHKIPSEEGPFTLHAVVTGDKVPWNMFSVAEQRSVTEPAGESSSNETSEENLSRQITESNKEEIATKSDYQLESPTATAANIYLNGANTEEPYESLILSLTFLVLLSFI